MTQDQANERLSRISTRWSLVCQAHSGNRQMASDAQLRLLLDYSGAVSRYLLGALRDNEAADELAQEFAVRFIRGDFRGVDPQRGRFRDYVKTVLFRMVANFYKQRQKQPRLMSPRAPEPAAPSESADAERNFLDVWRGDLVERAWQALAQLEQKKGQPYHSVLRFRIDHADDEVPSAQMAEELSARLGKRFTADGIRKILQRAREKFAEFLIEDVSQSLSDPTPEALEQELRDLGLLAYCRPILERRGRKI
jgi:DNA-directed RNA polymerase specialized sigma24 family protein